MPTDLSNVLVIGVSSRALFDLEKENQIFEEQGIKGYRNYQQDNENSLLEPGTAFHLVKNLLNLNNLADEKIVEVIIMSRNSPETGVRMLNAIKNYSLDITRMALTGGKPLSAYIKGFSVDLFLSRDLSDVQKIIDSNSCAAALIYDPPKEFSEEGNEVKIAFDADAVVFSEDSELRNKTEGLDAFHKYESDHEDEPLKEGPFAQLLVKLSKIQNHLPESIEVTPLRLAIVTARNAPSHMRVIKTLREWGVYVDEAYFLGGLPKHEILGAFGAHIFFDDQDVHLNKSHTVTPSGRVPYKTDSPLRAAQIMKKISKNNNQMD